MAKTPSNHGSPWTRHDFQFPEWGSGLLKDG